MKPQQRQAIFFVVAIGFAAIMMWGLIGLPQFGNYRGPYGDLINQQAAATRHVTNMVTAVNFDYRAMDTLGEEFIFFAAITSLALLLRQMRGEQEQHKQMPREPSDAVRWLGLVLCGVTVLFGLSIVLHAHLTPGGGFQGGAILGTGLLVVYLVTDPEAFERLSPRLLLEIGDSGGAMLYAVIGFAAMLFGGAFLENMLPLGETGQLFSGGMMLPVSIAVGVEVAAGYSLTFREFIKQLDLPERASKQSQEPDHPRSSEDKQ